MYGRVITVSVLFLFVLSALPEVALSQQLEVEGPIDLGPGVAMGMNNRGMVVGVTPHAGQPFGVPWRPTRLEWATGRRTTGWLWENGQRTELATLGGDSTFPRDVNQAGHVVGASENAAGFRRAFLWRAGHMIDLGTLGGTWSEAFAINRRGEVVGRSADANGRQRAFIWRNGRMTALATPDDASSSAHGINRFGHIVGTVYDANLVFGKAVLWDKGQNMIDLEEFIDPVAEEMSSAAHDINDAGQIVGEYVAGLSYGYRLDGLDAAKRTQLFAGFSAFPTAINSAGIAVGCGADEMVGCYATAWDSDGRGVGLPCIASSSPNGCGAHDINDEAYAVGWAHQGTSWEDVEHRAVLWNLP